MTPEVKAVAPPSGAGALTSHGGFGHFEQEKEVMKADFLEVDSTQPYDEMVKMFVKLCLVHKF